MKRFVARFESLITGVLSGFDRLVFRGSLLPRMRRRGMHDHLAHADVRLLDFGAYAEKTSERVKAAALAPARGAGRPVQYLSSSRGSKEELASALLREHPTEGDPVCALYVVEPCRAFEYHKSAVAEDRGLRLVNRKCLHSRRTNEHYLDALAVVDDSTPVGDILDRVAAPTEWRGKRVRALRTGDPADVALLAAVSRGEFAIGGCRNREGRTRSPSAGFMTSGAVSVQDG